MKRFFYIFPIVFIIFNLFTTNIDAADCQITANVGSTLSGGQIRVNTLVNTNGLDSGRTYRIVLNTNNNILSSNLTEFQANGGTIQYSFDTNASPGGTITLTVNDYANNICNITVPIPSAENLTPNNNNNLPPQPGSGGLSGNCPDTTFIDTAVGCVPIGNSNSLIGFILKWALGIGGGVAFLLILMAGFQIMTSRGDPNRLKAGQELMTSAIAGLLLLIFSVVVLRIIGVDILQIKGLVGQ